MGVHMTGNRYLEGNYAPVSDEVTAFDLPVIGQLPAELSGRYLRNGPNPWKVDAPKTHHWFAGDGMVHGVRLNGGRAEWYRNRYVGSTALSELRGQPDIGGRNWNDSPGGPNTNVGGFAGTTWAMVEAGGCPVELTCELETVARNDFFGTLPGAFTAHPKVDSETGEMHAMVYALPQWMDHVQYVVVAADGKVRKTVDVPECYSFHPMNAYDAPDGSVVIDLCVYSVMFAKDLIGPFGDGPARLERWTVNPSLRTCGTTVIDDTQAAPPTMLNDAKRR